MLLLRSASSANEVGKGIACCRLDDAIPTRQGTADGSESRESSCRAPAVATAIERKIERKRAGNNAGFVLQFMLLLSDRTVENKKILIKRLGSL